MSIISEISEISELSPDDLRKVVEPDRLGCKSTEELTPLKGIIGQKRAIRALEFGLNIQEDGFNIFVAGPPGTGRETAVKEFLEELAKSRPTPSDWCYVNNFEQPYEPNVIQLPPGKGKELKKDMNELIEDARRAIPEAFEGEEFDQRRDEIMRKIEEDRKNLFDKINKKAEEEGFVLRITSMGLNIIPVVDGEPMDQQTYTSLSEGKREEIQRKRQELETELRSEMRELRDLEKKYREEFKKLNREIALYAIGHLFENLREKYGSHDEVITYLDDVQEDIIDNLQLFMGQQQQMQQMQQMQMQQMQQMQQMMQEATLRKYDVNVLIDNSRTEGCPVIFERNTTYQNLFGRIEKEAQFGMLTTDFTMIHPGSVHKANGGYLVIPVEELARNPYSYDSLKRALQSGEIAVEELAERMGFISTKGLKPDPIPLEIKLVLMGDSYIYHMLYMMDKDFKELFKVKADFDTVMDKNDDNIMDYASFFCTLCNKENLKHLDASAVARLAEYGSRLSGDQDKLSTRFADIADIVREANYYAVQDEAEHITADHVKKTIDEKTYRSNLLQEKIQEMIRRGLILIDIDREVAGQVNGLSVIGLGDFAFGRPSRVTASIGLGRDGIIDIEREAKLGGPIHTKGVMILSGYLSQRYARDTPLSLSARLVFEQSYEGVEGDSASSTELYALLSALSGYPIKQNLAVTGSVNQKGEVQAIGGVNEKIEGYYEVCKQIGLNGKQGVLIPHSNVQNLMLKEEVINAVREGKFHVYPVETIDQGIEILTGVKAGALQPDGTFEPDTVNYMVDKRLREISETLKEYQGTARKGREED
ncbi:MAG: Lon protease family protein [Archaeoglobaceae archaeon]